MKKFYYFSQSKLQFVEIKNFKKKFLTFYSFSILASMLVLLFGYILFNKIFFGNSSSTDLSTENTILKEKLLDVATRYDYLKTSIDSLTKRNNELRLAANLPGLSDEELLFGSGGETFNDLGFNKNADEINLDKALSLISELENKLNFEKEQYRLISQKLKMNQKLYESIPAIKPTTGIVGEHGFGMRLHPILRINRMHDGVDIITSVGTPVYAPGKGKVDFVGRRGGLGLCIEIDHGFGYRTVYGHLLSSSVKVGDTVNRGELFARTGNSGLSSGPHLHYEVHHDGVKKDPSEFFFNDFNIFELIKK
ncbi:MAG: M23 family metallopeptidase [Ignavibacteriaceae bacterium]|nr:M23 family metallopeptidase [Ignavibacteriaceae bacterium]